MKNVIEELKRLNKLATPGPWEALTDFRESDGFSPDVMRAAGPEHAVKIYDHSAHSMPICEEADRDADFIAAMRNSLDLWLELADAMEQVGCHKWGGSCAMVGSTRAIKALKKLRGET